MRVVTYIQISKILWTDWRITSVSNWMYMVLMMLSTEMHTAEPLVPEIAIEELKNTSYKVLIKFRENWTKQEVMHYVLGPAGLLILFWIRKNCHSSGRNLLYLFIRRVTKLVIVEGYKCYQPCTKSIQYSCLKVNSTCRQNYRVSVWIST